MRTNQSNDRQCWGYLHVWTTNFRRCPLKSSNSFRREVDVHQQVSFQKGYVPFFDQLLRFGLESIAVLSWMSYYSNMISTLHLRIISMWVWFQQQPKRLGPHQRALKQIWQKLTIWHRDWIERSTHSFQIIYRSGMILIDFDILDHEIFHFSEEQSTIACMVL